MNNVPKNIVPAVGSARSLGRARPIPGEEAEAERIRAALREERLRVSRELHDGPLQSLTGAALQLQALALGMGQEFRGIRKRLREIQQMLLEEERDLRQWIDSMKHDESSPTADGDPAAHIARLCRRMQRQWGLPIRFTVSGGVLIGAPRLSDEVYRLVQEGLVNVVKHARASLAHVDRSLLPGRIRIVVQDNGRGFPFHGRFDLAGLTARAAGPKSIMARIASLGGTLLLVSSPSGSRLEIDLPVRPRALSAHPGSRT